MVLAKFLIHVRPGESMLSASWIAEKAAMSSFGYLRRLITMTLFHLSSGLPCSWSRRFKCGGGETSINTGAINLFVFPQSIPYKQRQRLGRA
ncbi:MAG: hypothetical protein AAB466_14875 [Verrucomicrobiota bacterium]